MVSSSVVTLKLVLNFIFKFDTGIQMVSNIAFALKHLYYLSTQVTYPSKTTPTSTNTLFFYLQKYTFSWTNH